MEDQPAVIVRDAYKYYGSKSDKRIVLNHLNMTVERGSIYGLLGSSGCGKTTLLSCVVGRRALMSGNIQVLPDVKQRSTLSRRIGYMPQEVALVGEFSVKDAIFYFGRIYGLEEDELHSRFQLLSNLLDLPDKNRYVKNCSGGQQRRVSFAAALVHEPELLILDEPTVGLDPVLRASIWEHLIEIATKNNVAVVITTHYIEETRQANRIGLMRGGKLLAEAAPDTVMKRYGCSTLEETFLILSVKQSRSEGCTDDQAVHESTSQEMTETEVVVSKIEESSTNEPKRQHPKVERRQIGYLKSKQRKMLALLYKNMQQFGRHPGGFIFSLIFPIVQLLSFFVAVGHEPRIINVGIVNDEIPNWNECLNYTGNYITYNETEYTCQYEKLSCKYIKTIDDSVIVKKFYPTIDEGLNAVKRGEILGALYLASNFSEALEDRNSNGKDVSDANIDASTAYYWLDMSNHQLSYFLKKRIYVDYISFNKDILTKCRSSPRLSDIPIKFNTPIHGSFDTSYTDFMVPGVMLTILFFLATTVTSTILIMDRLEGVWDRTIVAGVGSGEILIVHITLQTVVIVIQTIEIIIFTFVGYQVPFKGDIFNISSLLFFQGMAGMCFGFFISVICDSYTLAFFVSSGFFYPMIMLCGIVWPIEGMVQGIRYISVMLPFTIPIISIRDIIEKGYTITNPRVYQGYFVTFVWIAGLIGICYGILRFRRK